MATANKRLTRKAAVEPLTKGDLYELDIRLGERFTVLQGSINGLHERMTAHEQNHNVEDKQQVVEKELKLDAKKAGIIGLLASFAVVVAAAIKALLGAGTTPAWW